jgi:hypothetical protein
MSVAVLLGVIACGPGLAHPDTRVVARQALLEASGNEAAIAKLLQGSVVNGGLWFEDPACTAQFPDASEIAANRLPAFAHCLAGLHLQPSAREDALGDVVVMTYGGFEIEARVVEELSGPRLSWIGYESRRDVNDNLPTITPQTLESLRISGDRNGPLDPSVAKELELDLAVKVHAAFTWVKVCLDETGAVTAAHPHETTSPKASAAFVTAARTWQFRPFTIRGQALPVCTMVRMAYPPGEAAAVETLPMPPPPSSGKREPIVFAEGAARKFTEAKRIAGERFIHPDDRTKVAMHDSRVTRVVGSFRLCLDETGHVESVLPMRSTGFAAYDRELMAAMRSWVYSPFVVDTQTISICTAITFIYSQR